MDLEEREKYAKSVVNKLRKERGLRALGKLKRGIPKHPTSCVLAVSLPCREVSWAHDFETMTLDGKVKIKDMDLVKFAEDFDEGKYPHLEQPKTPIKYKPPGSRKGIILK